MNHEYSSLNSNKRNLRYKYSNTRVYIYIYRERERERETDRQTDKQTDRQTDRQADRQRQREIDRQTDGQTDRNDVCFQWRNEITNLTSGISHCDVVFPMSLLHMTFGETDAQEMQKCYRLGKFSSALNPCGCEVFSFIIQKSSRFFSQYFSSSLSMLVSFNCSINVNFACLLKL